MAKKTKLILIAVALIIISICLAYFLDFAKWKEIETLDRNISQVRAENEAKESYYTIIDSKLEDLNNAGWESKKERIAINFTSSPFFIPKINTFLQSMVTGSGMTMTGITSSAAMSANGAVQSGASQSGTKSSQSANVKSTSAPSYYNQLKGPVKRTTINLNIMGTYAAFKNLLSQLENQTRIITIKSIAVAPAGIEKAKAGSKNNLSFNIVLDVYSY